MRVRRGLAAILAPLLLVLQARGQESAIVSLRLNRDMGTTLRGWVVAYDGEGLVFERFGGHRRRRYSWSELFTEDAVRLRQRFGLAPSADAAPDLVEGHRIRLVDGRTLEGVLERIDEKRCHWVHSDGLLLPIPGDRIDRIEEIRLREEAVYDEQQLYLRRLQRDFPRSAREHRDLADYAFQVGAFREAKKHYRQAGALHPRWRVELAGRLAEVESYLQDAEIGRELGRVKHAARYERDFERARRLLAEFRTRHPDRLRAAIKLEQEIEEQRVGWLARRFHYVKNEEFPRVIERYLTRRRPSLEEALSWVEKGLPDALRARLMRRLEVGEEEIELLLSRPGRGSPHWASYWSGSFVISKRAVKGESSPTAIRGDPDRWWNAFAGVQGRANFLRAYAAEHLPELFEVVQVRIKPCEKCGGTGKTGHVSPRGLLARGGRHSWQQRCPRCFGALADRSVGYR
jgi:hypothetical protein